MTGLLVVQIIIGYEWLVSGVTKLWRGGFASGLAGELRDKSRGVAGWYRDFLDKVVIPHAWGVGWAVLVSEIVVGLILIAGAIAWMSYRPQRRWRARAWWAGAVCAAVLVALLMNVSFHLANAAPHPWLIPKEGFDEGVDLDSLMPLIEGVLAVVNFRMLLLLRRTEGSRDFRPYNDITS